MAKKRSTKRKRSPTAAATTTKARKMGKSLRPRFELAIKSCKPGESHPDIQKIQKYLTRFGYITSTVSLGVLDSATCKSLKVFQNQFGLNATGQLNPETVNVLQKKRCGNPDIATIESGASSNFVLRGCSYSQRTFTYRFVNGTGDIGGTNERQAIRGALATWASVVNISFVERTSEPVDFRFGWSAGSHGDGNAFDGVSNTLAHAFYPPPCGGANSGHCHFDEAETWSRSGAGSTIDLETVALHESGHLLGLDHSTVAGSVMFANYGGVRRGLTQDDIDGIRRLYSYFIRRGDSASQAGFVGEIAAIKHGSRQVVNAAQTQSGTLKLIAWRVNSNGSVTRTGDSGSQAGKASSISIAKGSRYVTACRTSSGDLKLISWDINSTGNSIVRRGDSGSAAGKASIINLVAMSNTLFVTPVRTSSGKLKLISWRLNSNGSFTRLADGQAGAVSEIASIRTSTSPGVGRILTAVRDSGGNLKLITWQIATSGAVSRRGDSGSQAGKARNIRVSIDQFAHPVTPVRASNGDLKLIVWKVNSSGSLTRLGDSANLAGQTGGHDIVAARNQLITAVRTGSGDLKLIAWRTISAGAVTRIGDSNALAGTASLITLNEPLTGSAPIVTSVRTASSSLKLITWDTM